MDGSAGPLFRVPAKGPQEMDLVAIGRRADLYQLTYRVAPGTYHVYYCHPQGRHCSCAGYERTDCPHLREVDGLTQQETPDRHDAHGARAGDGT